MFYTHGWVHVIAGCMFCGKTDEMLRLLRRFSIAGRTVVLIKPRLDTRTEDRTVVSRSGAQHTAVAVDDSRQIEALVGDADIVAIEEGQTWVPPSDPPTVPSDDPQGIDVAAGTGVEGMDERYDGDHRTGGDLDEGDLNGRIREAIRNDAATSVLADRLEIAVVGSTAILRGVVDDIGDGDALAAVIEQVDGIDDVRDETAVVGLD